MHIKSKIIAVLSTAVVTAASVISFSGSAAIAIRDANGDSIIDMSDAVYTMNYLNGNVNPTNVKSLDFDGNGIISSMDTLKIQLYKLQLISENLLPPSINESVSASNTTRNYWKHDYSNSNLYSKTSYSLTVKSDDNTVTAASDIEPYTIIPPDNMVRDYDTSVVRLNMPGIGHGTGFIVGDHVIATAAHCVYGNGKFYNMTIDIVDENNNTAATFAPSYVHIPSLYATNSFNYDYALIYVDEDLSEYGMFKMGVALDEYVNNNGSVIASGFPGEYPDNYTGEYGIRFKAQGNLALSTQYKLYYDADTFGGNSGGPVYVEEGFTDKNGKLYETKTVVAIHTNGFNITEYPNGKNSGTRITPDILKFFYNNSYMA